MNLHDEIVAVLKLAKQPLHCIEIVKKVILRCQWIPSDNNPYFTVISIIESDIKANGDNSVFVKVDDNKFCHKKYFKKNEVVILKSSAKNETPNVSSLEETLSYIDSAEKVLREYSGQVAMHYKKITKIALEKGFLDISTKTPELYMINKLKAEIKLKQKKGELPRFIAYGEGYFGLTQWHNKVTTYQVEPYAAKEIISYDDIAEKVLLEYSAQRPMHYKEITKIAQEKGLLVTSSLEPEKMVINSLITDIEKCKNLGRLSRFVSFKDGYFALNQMAEKDAELIPQIESQNNQIAEKDAELIPQIESQNNQVPEKDAELIPQIESQNNQVPEKDA
ncbi:MAG: winged helix-turn-helix domain-containing protein, partial [Deltaproteobacteria bacterium]|nr:winged helix-turn-helix domain-containing protein [Deltaproteobacteria bacterium]